MTTSLHTDGTLLSPASTLLEDVLDATPEATVITHAGRILHVNRAFSLLFGYALQDCVGDELDALVIPDGHLHENELIFYGLNAEGRSCIESVRKTRSGEEIPMTVLVSRIRLGGDERGMFVTYRDLRQRKQEEARLQHVALHDGLTGLANRTLFLSRMELTLARLRRRPDRAFALVFLDLDGFKQVNDRLGHAAGDRVLVEVSERLVRSVRPQDTVARFGGDEFAMLLNEVNGLTDLDALLHRVQHTLQAELVLDKAKLTVSASLGATMASASYATVEEMLRDADTAMYQAKASGKASHVVFGAGEPGPVLGFGHGGHETNEQEAA